MKTFHFDFIIKIITAETHVELYKNLYDYLCALDFNKFIIWKVENNIAEPKKSRNLKCDVNADVFDLGYDEKIFSSEKIEFVFFDITLEIHSKIFFIYKNVVTMVITFHEDADFGKLNFILEFNEKIAQRLFELDASEKRSEIFVDYQKKIDFLKSSSSIFSSINVESLIDTAQDFFMTVFSAEAACVFYEDLFSGIGVKEKDLYNNIKIKGLFAIDYLKRIRGTEFISEELESEKFTINNCFIIHDEKYFFTVVLFNIHVDYIPDKELSELISSIVTIALDNARNHEKMMTLKLEETEMEKTVDILNKFVPNEIQINEPAQIFGVSYPAKKTGGDYFNVVLKENKILICVADVCGKGYDAAVVTVVLSVINEMVNSGQLSGSMNEIASYTNQYILSKNLDGRFVTAFFAIYDFDSKEMEYISFGHEPTVLIKNNKKILLEAEYLPVGIMNENYETKKIKIDTGDCLFIYTDGIIEYIDYEILYEKIQNNIMEKPDIFIKNLYKELVIDTDAQKDDFTCLMLKF